MFKVWKWKIGFFWSKMDIDYTNKHIDPGFRISPIGKKEFTDYYIKGFRKYRCRW